MVIDHILVKDSRAVIQNENIERVRPFLPKVDDFFIEIFQIIQLHTSLHNGLVKYDIVLGAWIINVEIISKCM